MSQEQGVLGKYIKIIFDSEASDGIRDIFNLRTNNPNALIVFATGCMDVAQSGHPIFTEQLRSVGNRIASENTTDFTKVIVVVGIGRDSTIKALKQKGRPINTEMNRSYLLASYKEVDFVILNESNIYDGKIDFKNILKTLRTNVFIVNSDDSAIEEKKGLMSKIRNSL